MYLKRCEVKNFRSIRDLSIGFENKFQILVGLNEAGESNILKALSFLNRNISPEDDDIRDTRHDESPIHVAYIRFVFGLEKSETKQIYENLRQKFKSKNHKTPIIQIGSKNYTLREFCDHKREGLYVVNLLKKNQIGATLEPLWCTLQII